MSGQVKLYYKLSSGDKILSSVIEKGWCASNFFGHYSEANGQ